MYNFKGRKINCKRSGRKDEIIETIEKLTFGIEIEFDPRESPLYGHNRELSRVRNSSGENPFDESDRPEDDGSRDGLLRNTFYSDFPDWEMKGDGSVANGEGMEVTSPIFVFTDFNNDIQEVGAVLKWLKKYECKTCRSAGIHVHISAVDPSNQEIWGVKTIRNALKLVLKYEDILYKIASSGWKTHRGKGNNYQYCHPTSQHQGLQNLLDSDTVAQFRERHWDRYQALNIDAWWQHNTLEFRVFNASLNINRIVEYIIVCGYIIATAIRKKDINLRQIYLLGGIAQLKQRAQTMFGSSSNLAYTQALRRVTSSEAEDTREDNSRFVPETLDGVEDFTKIMEKMFLQELCLEKYSIRKTLKESYWQ